MPRVTPNNIVAPTGTDERKNIVADFNALADSVDDAIESVKINIGDIEEAMPQRYERRENTVDDLPTIGDYIGQPVWIEAENIAFYWSGTEWVDPRTGTGVSIFVQATAPTTGMKTNDLWFW